MAELNSLEQKLVMEILSCKNPLITLVRDFNFSIVLAFNRDKYSGIVQLIKSKDWEAIKSNTDKCETDFREDLYLVKFTNQNEENCVATIYDSDELWQDPQLMEIFIL